MKKLRRIISVLLCLAFLLAAGCTASPATTPATTAEPAPAATAEPAPAATAEPAPTATAEPAPAEEDWYTELEARYEEIYADLGDRTQEWEKELETCTEAERRIMKYYFTSMPMSDVVSLDYTLLHKFATHAAMLREASEWTAQLDEEIFLSCVAAYKVDREPLEDNREFFYNEVMPGIEGKTMGDAALLVNLWCGEQATYSDSDQRVASPMGMYNGGFGRCGEEANFVVNVLRSVGIPARICNTTWTIVLGGHAFVEVLVDGEWHYMGACEPEAALDVTWFWPRLGSLLTTMVYSPSNLGMSDDALYDSGYYVDSDVSRYTSTKTITVTVLGADGAPAKDCEVQFILTLSDCYPEFIASIDTDENGRVSYATGHGSYGVMARLNGEFRYAWVNPDDTEVTLSFAEPVQEDAWQTYAIEYSTEETPLHSEATEEQKTAFFGDKDVGAIREANRTSKYDAEKAALYPDCEGALISAGRNFDELISFLAVDDDPMRQALVMGLGEKDCREITAEILEDLLKGAEAVRGDISDEDFIAGLLQPVYDYAAPTAHRLFVQQMFTAEELAAFRAEPSTLYDWFMANISDESIRECKGITPDLISVLNFRFCPQTFQITSLMQLARSVGIPVKYMELPDYSLQWNYLKDGEWTPIDEWMDVQQEAQETGTVIYNNAGAESFEGLQWLMIRVTDDAYRYTCYWTISTADPEETSIELPAGNYIMWLVSMDTEFSGTQYVNCFTLDAGEMMQLAAPVK